MRRPFDATSAVSLAVISVVCAAIGWRVIGSNGKAPDARDPSDEAPTAEPAERGAAQPDDSGGFDGGAFEFRLAKPDHTFELSEPLKEISDLSLADDQESLWAVSDEKGTLFRISLKDGSVLQTIDFHKKGDFEGVATVGGKVIAARSDGELYVIEPATSASTHFSATLGVDCNLEGIAYEAQSSRLLLACKTPMGDKANRAWAVYRFDLENKKLDPKPALLITRKSVEAYLETHGREQDLGGIIAGEVDPSGIAIQPKTGLIFIISTRGRLLLVVDQSGALRRIEKLDRKVHLQPEGIAFGGDGALYLSNEARGQTPVLHRFVP